MKKFFSIEYVDLEGDLVVKHAIMDDSEKEELLKNMMENGIKGNIYDLSQQQEEEPEPL